MTEEKLLSKETFIDLFGKNDVERIDDETKLFIEAKKLGIEKKFEQTLKKYEKLLNEKIPLEMNLKLPECKYDISNYNMGMYICTINGIVDSKTNFKFSYLPILPVERYINQDTGKEKIKIIYYKENKWQEMIVDRTQLTINNKLLLLGDYGLDITSENVRYYVNYFNEILNINNIKKLESVSHLGWKQNDFIPYDSHGIFDGANEFKNIYKAISSKGDYELWKNEIQKLRNNKIIKILIATTLASPLLEKLNLQPYIVNLWSSMSGSGKTLSCMVAMSVWGNPNEGFLTLSSNNTQNYYTAVSSFMRNITCYFDELQIIKKSKYLDTEELVMNLCNNTDKGRLNKDSKMKEVKSWFNNFLFTNNDRLVKENAGEQVYNRVIDLEINEKLIKNGHEIARIIRNNYGFAGKEYIKYIQKIGFDKLSKRYDNIYQEVLKTTKATDKQAGIFTSILLADQLAVECLFDDDYVLEIQDIVDLVNDKNEIRTSVIAKNYIIDIINVNKKRFNKDGNYSEIWGEISELIPGYVKCKINYQILIRELKHGGFDFNSVKKEWADNGFLEKNSQGRYIHNTTIKSEKGNFIILNLTI